MKKATILIAERDEILRQNLKWRLLSQGFEIIEASDKATLFRSFHCSNPNLVIIGSSRNGTWDGLRVPEQIRQRNRNIPIILIKRHSCEPRIIATLSIHPEYFVLG